MVPKTFESRQDTSAHQPLQNSKSPFVAQVSAEVISITTSTTAMETLSYESPCPSVTSLLASSSKLGRQSKTSRLETKWHWKWDCHVEFARDAEKEDTIFAKR